MEFDLESENVRSMSRVWYANGSADELPFDDEDDVDDMEFDLSILKRARRDRRGKDAQSSVVVDVVAVADDLLLEDHT